MKKKRIGVDVDGVKRDLFSRLVEVYLIYYPNHIVTPIERWTNYKVSKYFPIGEEIYEFWFKEHPSEIYLRAKAYVGAIEMMYDLRQQGNEVIIVSKQPYKHLEDLTRTWLNLNNVPNHGIKFTQDKGEFEGDFILEDSPIDLKSIAEARNTKPICFNQPWNQDWKGKRVKTHKEFLDLVRNHA